eukprot:TRINITY_DN5127_c0_g1_i1.p1 TRINITY_DN5127_c0_g1~~TRINITY_DN5127_c0_g1_i1.p1  ORF type:complete len:259 (-),score=77.91 TRINITY_DN5127_c0_g1_i1:169-885(-)
MEVMSRLLISKTKKLNTKTNFTSQLKSNPPVVSYCRSFSFQSKATQAPNTFSPLLFSKKTNQTNQLTVVPRRLFSEKATPTETKTTTKEDLVDDDLSFIERVKIGGANAMLGVYHRLSHFDQGLDGMVVEKVGNGTVTCSIEVTKRLANSYGTLHGGAICTIVDIVGTMAMLTLNPLKPGVSIDLNTSFLAAVPIGESVIIEGKVLKQGKSLAFTQVDLYRKKDKVLIASGRHTKSMK